MLTRSLLTVTFLLALRGSGWGVELPETVVLPSKLVGGLSRYLAERPYREVAPMLGLLDVCLRAQIPNEQGAVVADGRCPEVKIPAPDTKAP